MSEHNPWKGDGEPATGDIPDTLIERLRAINGADIDALNADEAKLLRKVVGWYFGLCVEHGQKPPRDVLRCLLTMASKFHAAHTIASDVLADGDNDVHDEGETPAA